MVHRLDLLKSCPERRWVVSNDNTERYGRQDLAHVPPEIGAMASQHGKLVGDDLNTAETIPQVGKAGDDPQRLLLTSTPNQEGEAPLERPGHGGGIDQVVIG